MKFDSSREINHDLKGAIEDSFLPEKCEHNYVTCINVSIIYWKGEINN